MMVLASALIVAVLALQAVATFDLLPALYGRPSRWFWPFLDYPMYRRAHHEGDLVERHVVLGAAEDGSQVQVAPADVGLNFWKFRSEVVGALRRGDRARAARFAEMYRARTGRRLVALRLEEHGDRLTREGLRPIEPRHVATLDLRAPEAAR